MVKERTKETHSCNPGPPFVGLPSHGFLAAASKTRPAFDKIDGRASNICRLFSAKIRRARLRCNGGNQNPNFNFSKLLKLYIENPEVTF